LSQISYSHSQLNASDERGIGVVRDKIVSFASSQGLHDMMASGGNSAKRQIKLVILDEAGWLIKNKGDS
jgi:DNA polymerase III delta prime subunit